MKDAIVVGGGIIGATVALALRKTGREVLLLDDGRPMSGTAPSGGHLKPSWFSGMKKDEYDPAMELLEDIWGMTSENFQIRPTGVQTKVYRVDTDKVLDIFKTRATVTSIEHLENFPLVRFRQLSANKEERCRLLVVATGAWCKELLPELTVQAKQGVSFRVTGSIATPFIKPWAPYKQIVAHQQEEKEIWIGDGTAILSKNWEEKHILACQERCLAALPPDSRKVHRVVSGFRAYIKDKSGPCLLKQLGPRAWVTTGAGKGGTIAAGWAARRILDACSN
jgi:glycine/D-amino acid oxidase-like deaminating enzyme